MKDYDVHFTIKFSDFLSGVEATTKEEAKQCVLEMIYSGELDGYFIKEFCRCLENKEEDIVIDFLDVLEVGKDI